MKRLLYLATLSLVATLLFAPAALAQTVETVPLNADGTCPEGYVTVNAPFCAQESPNTPGRVFGYGEGDLASQPTPTAAAEQYAPVATPLPSTGGPALLLPAAGLLIATGLLGMRMVRRRS